MQTYLPQQPGPPGDGTAGRRPTPATSEATRLLCAGAYIDEGFRDAVIDTLYLHEERIAAPSLGIDAARVLAHALRARRIELGWAAAIVLLWILSVPLTRWLMFCYLPAFQLLTLAAAIRGTAAQPGWIRRTAAWVVRILGWLLYAWVLWLLVVPAVKGGPPDAAGIPEEIAERALGAGRIEAWVALLLPLVLAWAVAMQRGQFARALVGELSRARFPQLAHDPAEAAEGLRFQRLARRIRAEQHAPLVLYQVGNPFCGAGVPYEPWSLSVELRPGKDREPEPLDNSAILRRIVPLLEALRFPSPHGSPELAVAVRDRLRDLELDEVVFLPVEGLPTRADAPCTQDAFERHRAHAIEEGGETRRHFLRIRVGGWGEGIVTTVHVRVHTQGGMLMLEVAPHVLRPVKGEYEGADRVAHRYQRNNRFSKAAWALARTPGAGTKAVVALVRGAAALWRLATSGYGRALPEGPVTSVRELGSGDGASLFQEMDVNRYLKSIQDRVANGVRLALQEAGWETDEFVQKIVNVAEGATFIETAKGAIAIGDRNTVINSTSRAGTGGGRGNG
ncbi:hypothetical protein [Streptomyces sp. BPTC-684]|uniref:hypothetical protein n=1 Tax=Streptomyces sp. BPTC-684 TaxID=3043734 RepID=UPI0024B26F01|nr:hypothetical protein [Streptomyces sp. BPTC-684]WHM37062.1 hypothetical protein QIY60_09245 [Streptomyces sp. BPTC-684]